jgi:hypothetical protein
MCSLKGGEMKRRIFIALALVFLLCFNAYAQTQVFVNMRNELFQESKKIKSLLTSSKDVFLLSSMWDACVMAMTQIDAYFSMLGIFNTIKEKDLSDVPIDYLSGWLSSIKQSNELNIKSLNSSEPIEENTKVYMEKLKSSFTKMNAALDNEISRLSLLKKSLTTTATTKTAPKKSSKR